MKEKIKKALQSIRPALQADGGDIELVSVEDGVVKVRLTVVLAAAVQCLR